MRILQINSVCGIRSTGRICTAIADTLRRSSDDCRIAYGRENIPLNYEKSAIRIGNEPDVKCHALMARMFDNIGKGSKRATKKFLKWVDDYNPDVIHLHNLHGYYINFEMLFNYLKKIQKPVVWTLHDCWAFTGHCAHFDYIGCQKWEKEGCHHCQKKKNYPSSLLFDRSKRNFIEKKQLFTVLNRMVIVTPSMWLADLTKRSFLGGYPIKVIHNGIDLSVFRPISGDFRDKYCLRGKIIFLGVATSWGESKGLYDFYEINKMKNKNEVIVLVGLTPQQISNLPDGIIGIQRTNSVSELAEIYSTADVFINPTYEETFGLTNVEAQACGTPAVTYRSGGSPEGVPCEHVVERGNIYGILCKARDVIQSPRFIDVTVFSGDACYTEYINLYRQMLE